MRPYFHPGNLTAILLGLGLTMSVHANAELPTIPTSYRDLSNRLEAAHNTSPLVELSSIGTSVEGRDLWSVRLLPKTQDLQSSRPAFLYAHQHGNEPAGQEALLELVEDVAQGRIDLPYPVIVIPSINPDGAERYQRRNANNIDLNRDHSLLSQPETRALHRHFRSIRPRLAVDCHEFSRDSSDYARQGWSEWPLIMLDTANFPHPIFDTLYDQGLDVVRKVSRTMLSEGIPTSRYVLGGAPPTGEVRFSSMEIDDGRNSMGLYGIPSYLIESGIFRNQTNEHADLPERVKAYRRMLDLLLEYHLHRDDPFDHSPIPDHLRILPTNSFWGQTRIDPNHYLNVVVQATSETIKVPAPRTMDQRIIKNVVQLPENYIVSLRTTHHQAYRELLDNHGIRYEILKDEIIRSVSTFRVLGVEEDSDPVYERFGGRQITRFSGTQDVILPPQSIIISTRGPQAIRAAAILDPRMLYGLHQFPPFRKGIELPQNAQIWLEGLPHIPDDID